MDSLLASSPWVYDSIAGERSHTRRMDVPVVEMLRSYSLLSSPPTEKAASAAIFLVFYLKPFSTN
jgi:hypothetical protein